MPTALRSGPYRFFYAGDRHEPPRVHIEREDNVAIFWLEPIRLEESGGFNRAELGRMQRIVEKNHAALLRKWHEFFDD
jgi:hypothetical protein